MAHTSVLGDTPAVLAAIGASDALVYRRVSGGRFTVVGTPPPGAASDVLVDDEPLLADALVSRLRRVASEQPRLICGGYTARAAAVVPVGADVIVVLGRHDGCLAGVSDDELVAAAEFVADHADR